jgi:hypothetical protein
MNNIRGFLSTRFAYDRELIKILVLFFFLLLTEQNKNNPNLMYSAAKIKIKFRDGKRHVVIKQKNDTEKSGFGDSISF